MFNWEKSCGGGNAQKILLFLSPALGIGLASPGSGWGIVAGKACTGKGPVCFACAALPTSGQQPKRFRSASPTQGSGYKVVHMVPRQSLTTLPKYDEMVNKQNKLSSNIPRPTRSGARTIGYKHL
jgi:hypothetical protein